MITREDNVIYVPFASSAREQALATIKYEEAVREYLCLDGDAYWECDVVERMRGHCLDLLAIETA